MLRGAADRLEASLQELGVDHDVKEYPAAGHSFLNDHDRSDLPLAVSVMMTLPGMGFHEPSAADAKQSEERRVGKECVGTRRSRWSPYQYKKKATIVEVLVDIVATHLNHIKDKLTQNRTERI